MNTKFIEKSVPSRIVITSCDFPGCTIEGEGACRKCGVCGRDMYKNHIKCDGNHPLTGDDMGDYSFRICTDCADKTISFYCRYRKEKELFEDFAAALESEWEAACKKPWIKEKT